MIDFSKLYIYIIKIIKVCETINTINNNKIKYNKPYSN